MTSAGPDRRPSCLVAPSEGPDHTVVSCLDIDAAEWPQRRARDHVAGLGVEVALVTGAVPTMCFGFVVDDASQVGAFLAERHDVGVADAEQYGGVGVGRIPEQVGAADLDARGVDDGAGFALVDGAQLRPRCETDVAQRERAGTSDEVAGELAAGDLFLGGGLVRRPS